MPNPQALEVGDFSGGITDNYIAANSQFYQEADNFLIGDDKFLVTRPALSLVDRDNARISTDARIGKKFVIDGTIVCLSDEGAYYKDGGGFNEILGHDGNRVFDVASPDAKFSVSQYGNRHYVTSDQLPTLQQISNDNGNWLTRTVGLPKADSTPLNFAGAAGGPYSYILQLKVSYIINGVTYEEVGPYSEIKTSTVAIAAAISNIPVITNTADSNYDVVNISTKIYRNLPSGSVFYKVGEVTNGTTTFNDTTIDADLPLAADFYDITNIAADVTQTPKAKMIHFANDILWLAQPEIDGVVEKSKLQHCVRFQPHNSPGDFFEDFEAEITGLSSINIYPIVFTKNSVYRVEGYYQANGSGAIAKRRISDTFGCISNDSIVQTNEGIFFCTETGFAFTDGYKVIKISKDLNARYQTLVQNEVQQKNMFGCYDKLKGRVLWSVQADSANDYPDTMFICHLRWGINETMPFTTWSGGKVDGQNFRPSSLLFYLDTVYVGDSRGYYLSFKTDEYVDDKIDISLPVDEWRTNAILYKYLSPSFDFGSPTLRKWLTWLVLNLDNSSSISLQASLARDNSALFNELQEVRYRTNIAWGDPDLEWGDETLRWNYFPLIATKRRIPSANRCSYSQLKLENSLSSIDSSTRAGTAVVDAAASTATLTGLVAWQEDCIDYYLKFPTISADATFKILERTDTEVVLEDTGGVLIDGTYPWAMYGYRRGEIIKLIEYSVIFTPVSMSQEPATAAV